MSQFIPPAKREPITGTQRTYGKKHERKYIGKIAHKRARNYLRRWLP